MPALMAKCGGVPSPRYGVSGVYRQRDLGGRYRRRMEVASGWTGIGRYGAWRDDVRDCTMVAGSYSGGLHW